jgi:hypothetical protein
MRALVSHFAQMMWVVVLVQPGVTHWRLGLLVISVLRGVVSMPVVYA